MAVGGKGVACVAVAAAVAGGSQLVWEVLPTWGKVLAVGVVGGCIGYSVADQLGYWDEQAEEAKARVAAKA